MNVKPISTIAIALLLSIAWTQEAAAVNKWYWGQVTQIITHRDDGSFIVYVDHPVLLADCLHKRVNVSVDELGAERTKAALSMALAAFAANKRFGVVVDIVTSGEVCVVSNTTQGAGIRD